MPQQMWLFSFFIGERRQPGWMLPSPTQWHRRRLQASALARLHANTGGLFVSRWLFVHIVNTSAASVKFGMLCLMNIKLKVEEFSEAKLQAAKTPKERLCFFSWLKSTEIPVNWRSAAWFWNLEDAAMKFWNRVSLESRWQLLYQSCQVAMS